jgi:hypothetical protein
MAIFKYTEEIQKQIGSKTKPEPWLHIAFSKYVNSGSNRIGGRYRNTAYAFAIYVWDSRNVLESGKCLIKPKDNVIRANDSKRPLNGRSNSITFVNDDLMHNFSK